MALPSDIASPSTISELISGIIGNRDGIRTTLNNSWGISEAAGKNLAGLKDIIQSVSVHDNIDVDIVEGDTYNIPKGYHTGAGVVKGTSGGGNYTLQAKTVSAGRSDLNVVPDQGKYGLSSVKVLAIPSTLQDVSYVTATASDVLTGKNIVVSNGTVTAGTMANNGTVTQTLNTSTTSYTIPQGYHSGSGTVSITTETKNIVPSTSQQIINATSGKVISSVTVGAIPGQYQDVSEVTTTPSQVLEGTYFVNSSGSVLEGTMANNSAETIILDAGFGKNQQYDIPEGYHNGEGTVKIVLETKTVTPSSSSQDVTPSEGKVLSKVTVAAIPAPFYDVSGVTATDTQVLAGTSFVTSGGVLTAGAMANQGAWASAIDGMTISSKLIPQGYHDGTGYVYLTNAIEIALASI